jgi:hypothetical protein
MSWPGRRFSSLFVLTEVISKLNNSGCRPPRQIEIEKEKKRMPQGRPSIGRKWRDTLVVSAFSMEGTSALGGRHPQNKIIFVYSSTSDVGKSWIPTAGYIS